MIQVTFQITLTREECVALAHHVLLSGIHRTHEKDREHSYQVRLLGAAFRASPVLKAEVLEEVSHVWSDKALEQLLERLP